MYEKILIGVPFFTVLAYIIIVFLGRLLKILSGAALKDIIRLFGG
jgi:hypothetical protein